MIRKSDQSSYTKKEIRGCVDLGSSNFRLLVVEGSFPVHDKNATTLGPGFSFREERRYVGWGEDLARAGSVSSEVAAGAARALCALIERSREWGCEAPYLVATNTLREADNARGVKTMLEEASGLAIRVLSQREEAGMGYLGASFFRPRDEPIVLIDPGGTSTEISWGRGIVMEGYRGFPLGTHRVHSLIEGVCGLRRAAVRLAEILRNGERLAFSRGEGVYPLPAPSQNPTILMTGGTAVSLAVCLRSMRGSTPSFEEMQNVTLDDVALARSRVAGLLRSGRERSLPLDESRIRLFPAGLVLVEALLVSASLKMFRVTARDVRWGVVLTGGGS